MPHTAVVETVQASLPDWSSPMFGFPLDGCLRLETMNKLQCRSGTIRPPATPGGGRLALTFACLIP